MKEPEKAKEAKQDMALSTSPAGAQKEEAPSVPPAQTEP